MPNYIWKGDRRYYLYGTYDNWGEVLKLIRYYKRKMRCKYFILPYEAGFVFPTKKWKLYFDKVIKLV